MQSRVKFLLEKQSAELEKYLIENKIQFNPNDKFEGEFKMDSNEEKDDNNGNNSNNEGTYYLSILNPLHYRCVNRSASTGGRGPRSRK